MNYPSLQRYNVSLLSYSKTLVDEELRHGTLKKTPLGAPFTLCGGFALTYQIVCGHKKYAVRCFHKHSDMLEERYSAISRKMSALRSKYFVDFEYQSRGILVDGNYYPVVKMEWAKGCSLAEFLSDNYRSAACMVNLRSSLQELATFLEASKIAHGDIQPGNIMVANDGKAVQLVDYDGMYVDEIARLGASETGHRNFQHPERNSETWNSAVDRFSFIQLCISLKALELDPSLWTDTGSDGDALLFRANDLVDPESSDIFDKLKTVGGLQKEIDCFETICLEGINKVPSLREFLRESVHVPTSGNPVQTQISSPRRDSRLQSVYLGAYPVVNGNDYENCLEHVGDRVELVARVHDVRIAWTKFRQKYAFINFDNWQGECVKLTIWVNVLRKFDKEPNETWIGKWLSITGMMELPYSKKLSNIKYTHLSITVNDPNEIHFITEDMAYYKLGFVNKDDENDIEDYKYNENSYDNDEEYINNNLNDDKYDEDDNFSDHNLNILKQIKQITGK